MDNKLVFATSLMSFLFLLIIIFFLSHIEEYVHLISIIKRKNSL